MPYSRTSDRTALYKRSPIPLYLQVASLLRRRILTGRWSPQEQMPSLEVLAQDFGVARLTVRQAMEQLALEGLVWKKQGKGTFVAETAANKRWLNLQTDWAALVKMVEGTSLKLLLEKEKVKCPDPGSLPGKRSDSYHFMRRVHLKDGEPYCLVEMYLLDRVFQMAPELFRKGNIVSVLDSLPEAEIASGRQVLTIGTADTDIAGCLEVALDSPIANLRRVVLDRKGLVVYLGDIVYRGDHVRLDINLQV